MSAVKFIVYQCAAALVCIVLWLSSGHQMYLFIAGIASGAGIVAACIGWDERSDRIAAERRARIG